MKAFLCECGQPLFFDSASCVHCHRQVGFCSETLSMQTADQRVLCANHQFQACNWLLPTNGGSAEGLCRACDFNRTIPDLSSADNRARWQKLEVAKKRLIYSLLALSVPLGEATPALRFDFLEDARTNPDEYGDVVHNTGYLNGVITVNVAEADDLTREQERVAANEQYRTLVGHLRHESGHYFFEVFGLRDSEAFKVVFGDPARDYAQALEQYYGQGPRANWQGEFISAYASSHPLEDWAETWGHYLHIRDVLETADSHGVEVGQRHAGRGAQSWSDMVARWQALSVVLNELNRSLGLTDVYPFVLNAPAVRKLEFVHKLVMSLP